MIRETRADRRVQEVDIEADILPQKISLRIHGEPTVESQPELGTEHRNALLELRSGPPEAYGKYLMDRAFRHNVHDRYYEAVRRLVQKGCHLRLRLNIDANSPELHSLWWECLYDADILHSLGCSPNLSLSRSNPSVSGSIRDKIKGQRLKMLIVISNPKGLGEGEWRDVKPVCDDEKEYQNTLEQALKDAGLDDRVDWQFLTSPASYNQIKSKLQGQEQAKEPFHILHIVAHGRVQDQGYLMLEKDSGETPDLLTSQQMHRLVWSAPHLGLVVLVACKSAVPPQGHPFLSLAGSIVRAGVPAVIAMQDGVSLETGRFFTRYFYEALANSIFEGIGSVDAAVNSVRDLLTSPGLEDPWSWAKPVLFMTGDKPPFELPKSGSGPVARARDRSPYPAANSPLSAFERPPSTPTLVSGSFKAEPSGGICMPRQSSLTELSRPHAQVLVPCQRIWEPHAIVPVISPDSLSQGPRLKLSLGPSSPPQMNLGRKTSGLSAKKARVGGV